MIAGLALGRIHVESPVSPESPSQGEESAGSRFAFILPVTSVAETALERRSNGHRPDGRSSPAGGFGGAQPLKRVLVVEDDPVNAMLMTAMLRTDPIMSDLQLDVQAVPTAEQALELIPAANNERLFDLVIFDEHLEAGGGQMLGSDAIKYLRQQGVDCIMISCSGNCTPEDAEAYLQKGASFVWPKPYPTSAVMRADLRKWFEC